MKFYRFYMRGFSETVVGIIQANSWKEAKEIFHRHYPDWKNWETEVKEVKFKDNICELYYGG